MRNGEWLNRSFLTVAAFIILVVSAPTRAHAEGFFEQMWRDVVPRAVEAAKQVLPSSSRSSRTASSPVMTAAEAPAVDPGPATAEIRKIPLATSDILIVGNRIFASVNSLSPQYPRSITVIDPATGTIERTLPLDDNPEKLAVSRDGQFLYVALRSDEGKILRLILPTLEKDFTFNIGRGSSGETLLVRDMKALPDRPESVIVTRQYQSYTPWDAGVVVYDDGIMRPLVSDTYGSSLSLAVGPGDDIYGFNDDMYKTYAIDVTADGVTESPIPHPAFLTYNFAYSAGQLYFSNGSVLDPAAPEVVPAFNLPGGRSLEVLPDANGERVYFLSDELFTDTRILAFNQVTHESTGYISLGRIGSGRGLARWGTEGLVFSSGLEIYLVTSSLIAPPSEPPVEPPVILPTEPAPLRPRADLTVDEIPVIDEYLNLDTLWLEVTNRGPHDATKVTATMDAGFIPAVEAVTTDGSCTTGTKIVCTWDSVPLWTTRKAVVRFLRPIAEFSRRSDVVAAERDPAPANNVAERLYFNRFFPLNHGYSWTYASTSGGTSTQTVLPKTEIINGRPTRALATKQTGGREYYSSGTDGIFLHRQYVPRLRLEGIGTFNVTLTYEPPLQLAGKDYRPEGTVRSTGHVTTNKIRGFQGDFSYSSEFSPSRDRISIRGTTYEVVKLKGNITIDGQSKPQTLYLAQGIGLVKMVVGDGQLSAELVTTNTDFHDLAIASLSAPKSVALKQGRPATGKVTAKIVNKSPHPETIASADMLGRLVTLDASSLGSCGTPRSQLLPPIKFPIVMQPRASLPVSWNVTFSCANDAAATSQKAGQHDDFTFSARVEHGVLEGTGDDAPTNDVCPRPATDADPGCGTRKTDGTPGGAVVTDVVSR